MDKSKRKPLPNSKDVPSPSTLLYTAKVNTDLRCLDNKTNNNLSLFLLYSLLFLRFFPSSSSPNLLHVNTRDLSWLPLSRSNGFFLPAIPISTQLTRTRKISQDVAIEEDTERPKDRSRERARAPFLDFSVSRKNLIFSIPIKCYRTRNFALSRLTARTNNTNRWSSSSFFSFSSEGEERKKSVVRKKERRKESSGLSSTTEREAEPQISV